MLFDGSTVAIVTPFTDDGSAVDFAKLEELIEAQLAGGTQTIVPCGTTGESPTLTHEEQEAVIEKTVKTVKGRAAVMAGTGSNSTAEALRLSRFADATGADGLLVVTPYYNKPTPEGQFRHFKAIAEAVSIPVVVYNVPGRSGTKISADTLARLYNEVENIRYVKEACGSVDQVSAILERCQMTVLSGDDMLTLPMMAVGGRGIVSVVANLVPADVRALTDAWFAGDVAEAQRLHYKLLPLARAMFIETNPMCVKTAMRLLGRCNGVTRMPLCDMAAANVDELRRILGEYGLAVVA